MTTVMSIYRKWVGRFIFRKLNIGIGAALLLVFALLGLFVYGNFYSILEKKEQQLLTFRTDKLKIQLNDLVERFKNDSVSLYQHDGDDAQTSVYKLFLPGNVPAGGDERKLVAEQNYLKNVLTHMLSGNPYAAAVFLYRLQDGRMFFESRQQTYRPNPEFSYPDFFRSFPLSYKHPFFGGTESLLTPGDRMIYLANPIYNPRDIRPDLVYGYHLVAIRAKAITDEFDARSPDSRLILKQNGVVLIDSRPDKTIEEDLARNLVSRAEIDRYGIELIGISYKSNLQSMLTDISIRILGILGISWLVCIVIIHLIQRFVVGRLKMMTAHFKKVQRNPFTDLLPVEGEDEIGDLMTRFNRMTEELQNHINQVYVAEIRKRDAEFIALKTQIHPHFLYNTLESLRMQAVISDQPALAEKLHHLGRLFRWMLQPSDELVSVQEELAYAAYYLELLMLGKSNRIELRVETSLNLESCFMLKFTLQPIVENAIQHGLLEQAEQPVILVDIRADGDLLRIEIENNGRPIGEDEYESLQAMLRTANTFPDQHLGLKNIHERIKHYYGNEYGLSLSEKTLRTGTFRLIMTFPRRG